MTDDALIVTEYAMDRIIRYALDAYPDECCGLLLAYPHPGGGKVVDDVCRMTGGERSSARFAMDPLEIHEKETVFAKRGLEIAGFYHSHPDDRAVLSGRDEEFMIPQMAYLIVSVSSEDCMGLSAWMRTGEHTVQLNLIHRRKD